MKKSPKKKGRSRSGPSGKHKHALRALSGISDDEWERYADVAHAHGMTRMVWIRGVLRAATK